MGCLVHSHPHGSGVSSWVPSSRATGTGVAACIGCADARDKGYHGGGSKVNNFLAVILWILLLTVFNLEDDLARDLGQFASWVVEGYNGG